MLLAGLEDAGILQCILDFVMFHDPKLKPFRGRMCSGHGELVFVYEGQPYRAVKWHPGKHFGRCAKRSCGCCKAHMRRRDIGCQECCCGFIVKSTCQLLKTATVVNAWRTTSCRCGGCEDSWMEAGWVCPVRWGNEWMDVVEVNDWWDLPVSRAV